MVRRVGDYLLGSTLGEGTFGKVKYATHAKTNEPVAMKVLDKERIMAKRMQEQILREISIMKALRHPSIVELKEVLHSKRNIYIVVELCTGGELFDKIVSSRRFEEGKARYYFRQLVEGLSFCHSKDVAHRDLKPENLLLSENDVLKISDFGLSANMNDAIALQTPCGTPNYVAPEVLGHSGYDGSQADVWSAGVVLYVMLAGALPFEEKTDALLFDKIKRGQYNPFPRHFSAGVQTLLKHLLVVDPKKRYTIKDVMKDPWFLEGGYKPTEYSSEKPVVIEQASIPKTMPSATVQEEKVTAPDVVAHHMSSSMKGPVNLDVFSLISMLQSINIGAMLGYRGDDNIKRETCFVYMEKPEQTFNDALQLATEMRLHPNPNRTSLKIRCVTSRVVVVIQVFILSEDLSVVQIQRRKGDTLEFHKLYKFFHDAMTKRCAARAGVSVPDQTQKVSGGAASSSAK